MAKVKSVPIVNEEALLFVQIVETYRPILTKGTNATNNQEKDEVWLKITDQFNASVSSGPQSTAQLRLKWENVKKAARKRSALIMRKLVKTGGGKPEYIAPDEVLDRVAAILGATCDGYSVAYGGDAESEAAACHIHKTDPVPIILPSVSQVLDNSYSCGDGNNVGDGHSVGDSNSVGDGNSVSDSNTVSDRNRVGDMVVLDSIITTTPNKKYFFGMSKTSATRVRAEKRRATDDLAASQIMRNKAVTQYYEKKQ